MNLSKITTRQSSINKNSFTTMPGEVDPKLLLLSYQTKLARSLQVYLKKLIETLKVDFSSLIEHLQNLNPHIRFSPALFAGYIQLKEAYDKKNVQNALDTVQFLKKLSEGTVLKKSVCGGLLAAFALI